MRVLITGIHGFAGTCLAKALSEKNTLYGLSTTTRPKEGATTIYLWDNLDKDDLPQVDAIVHLAGMAHDTKNQTQREDYFKINTGLTRKIFDYFLTSDSKKFIFFSSVKAVADTVAGILTEDVVPAPQWPYGESKLAAERYIESRLAEAEKKGKSVYILRPCMIHGPGNKGNLNLLYDFVKRGLPWPLGAFENKRTFTSADNLCYIVEGLLEKDVATGVYNVNDDEALSTNELVGIICDALGRKTNILHISKVFVEAFAVMGTWLGLPLNSERLRKLTENYVSSNAKVKRALGVDKLPVRARDGLKRTIQSFQE